MATLPFVKMHGIGNDYVYVDCFAHRVADPAALARRVSPRRTGIGSDGLILICPSDRADCRMEMYNADGSRGEMCGNGIDAPLDVGGQTYRVTCVSMGNPHCVVFLPDVEHLDLERLGPQFEHHRFFPRRVNTEFIRVDGPRRLRMRVWERGSGETAACGTGACAALVAAVLTNRTERGATVALNGGELDIEWRAGDDHVYMTGPAEEAFRGTVEVDI